MNSIQRLLSFSFFLVSSRFTKIDFFFFLLHANSVVITKYANLFERFLVKKKKKCEGDKGHIPVKCRTFSYFFHKDNKLVNVAPAKLVLKT